MTAAGLDMIPNAVRSVLIHKPDHLGDVLCAVPAIRALREKHPDANFVASVMPGPGEFLTGLGLVDEVFALPGHDWWKRKGARAHVSRCRRCRFDLAVNFRHDVRDIVAVGLMGARRVCTYTHRGIGARYRGASDPPASDRAEIDNHLTLVRTVGINAEFASGDLRRRVPPDAITRFRAGGPWIAFHPFSRTSAKTWPIEHAQEFARMAIDHGVGVRLVGSAENARDAEGVAVDSPRFVSHVGNTDAMNLMACVAAVDALVCTDSGPGHIGPLVGTPVVTIASGTNGPTRWAPRGATVVRREVPCAPCRREVCPVPGHPCMNDLTPGMVWAALSLVLGRT
ncbi:MAG: glycosyltransferase family 9 protein [Deltaproteobacteria bacterium]|nr:glycosyltransferase family 9 protein [Deltaproteobacteria bacterium]